MRLISITTILIALFSCTSKKDSPCLLQATFDGGSSSSSLIFKDDGTFEWTNGSGFGVYITEGKYSLNDNVIIIDKAGLDKVIKSNRLLLTSLHPNSKSLGKFLIQVDDQNNLIDSNYIFKIYIDNRQRNHLNKK